MKKISIVNNNHDNLFGNFCKVGFKKIRTNCMPKKWLTSEMFNPTFTLTDSAVSSAEGVFGVDAGGGGGGASPLPSPLEKK